VWGGNFHKGHAFAEKIDTTSPSNHKELIIEKKIIDSEASFEKENKGLRMSNSRGARKTRKKTHGGKVTFKVKAGK